MDPLDAWARHLRRAGRSPRTIVAYRADVVRLLDHVGHDDYGAIEPRHIETFLRAGARAGQSDATVLRRYRSVVALYRWLGRTKRVDSNPTSHVRRSALRGGEAEVLTDRDLAALLGACHTVSRPGRARPFREFEAARDVALVLLLVTTGLRTSELIGLTTDDVDLDEGVIRVVGRGEISRTISLLPLAIEALVSYDACRDEHPSSAGASALWLGGRGPLTDSGLRQMLDRRASAAGIGRVRPRHFRRIWAEEALRRGTAPEAVLARGGWESTHVLRRYRATATDE